MSLVCLGCEVVGVKLNELLGALPAFQELYFVREPDNPHDRKSVLVKTIHHGRHVIVGHVAEEAVKWLSPLLASFEAHG